MRAQFGKGLARYVSGFFLLYSVYLLLITPAAWTDSATLIELFFSSLALSLVGGLLLLCSLSPKEIAWDEKKITFTGWFNWKKEFEWEQLQFAASSLRPTTFAKLKFPNHLAISIFFVAYRPEEWTAFGTALQERFSASAEDQ